MYLDIWSGFEQLRLFHGRIGDSTTSVNSSSPQMCELVEDAVASRYSDVVGYFGSSGMSSKNLSCSNLNFSVLKVSVSQIFWQRVVQTRPKYSYCIFLKGLCWVSVCWILNNVPCLWCFLVFILCPTVSSIFGTICCVIFQIYIII